MYTLYIYLVGILFCVIRINLELTTERLVGSSAKPTVYYGFSDRNNSI